MKNEFLETKKLFQIVLTQCDNGITVEDLAHEASYSEADTAKCLMFLIEMDLVKANEGRYYPSEKAMAIAISNWAQI